MKVERVVLTEPPEWLRADPSVAPWARTGDWPAWWVRPARKPDVPFCAAYRLRVASGAPFRLHVAADEHYVFFVNGACVGRGAERGDGSHTFFDSYDIEATGTTTLVFQVWAMSPFTPGRRITTGHGLLVAGPGVNTGVAPWSCKVLPGIALTQEHPFGAGAAATLDAAAFAWGFERGEGDGWDEAVRDAKGQSLHLDYSLAKPRRLLPAMLPAMHRAPVPPPEVRHVDASPDEPVGSGLVGEKTGWQAMLDGKTPLTVPARTTRRVILDHADYYCAYTTVTLSRGRGAKVRVKYAESPMKPLPPGKTWSHSPRAAGLRDELAGKMMYGFSDRYAMDGSATPRSFETPWYRAGRYVEIVVETADEPLTFHALTREESRYALEDGSEFASSDARHAALLVLCRRTAQMCAHDTMVDCPFYEQQMYLADLWVDHRVLYTMTRDTRLIRRSLRLFEWARDERGFVGEPVPTHTPMVLPTNAMVWSRIVRDYVFWRGTLADLRAMMPGVRATVEATLRHRRADGLMDSPAGFDFVDWVWNAAWRHGQPPNTEPGPSCIIALIALQGLEQSAELEELAGEPLSARRCREAARALAAAIWKHFWTGDALADEPTHAHFSEHAQALAANAESFTPEQTRQLAAALFERPGLARMTYYFTTHYFDACRKFGRIEQLLERLEGWHKMREVGLKTIPEIPDPTRSECHNWCSHPAWHFYTTLAGITPTAVGFDGVRIEPRIGPLTRLDARLVHPKGFITLAVRREGGRIHGQVGLPPGVPGELVANGETQSVEDTLKF
jgi:hypothetical protein